MSTPHGQGGGRRASKPTAPVSPINTVDPSIASPMQQIHRTTRSNLATFTDQTQRPSINRRAAGPVPRVRAARTNMPSSVGGSPVPSAPSAMRKRRVDSFTDAFAGIEAERAAKRPANASTRPGLASGDAAVAQAGMSFRNMDEESTSSAAERMNSMSPGEVEPDAAGMSMEPAYVKREQPSADMMRPSPSENYNTAASTRNPVTGEAQARSRSESMDRSTRVAPTVNCKACHSQLHMTKNCHIPSSDGTVVICPFHNCSVFDKSGRAVHPLDGLMRYAPADWIQTPLYCEHLMRYEMAIERNNMAKVREMLPRIFMNLVASRRRKPSCRVVNKEVCFINITIEYSLQFCHGKMPAELEGKWPYTMRDATDPAMIEKLRKYDYPGLDDMPPGELEAKPWEQIKREYAQGIIPLQIHSKNRPSYRVITPTPITTELGDTEAHRHAMGTDFELQAVHEDGEAHSSTVQEDAVQSQDPMKTDVIIQMLSVLTEKVNALSSLPEQVNALSEQVAAISTSHENVDALSALREQVAAVSDKVDAEFRNRKDFFQKIVDSMP